MTLDELCTDYLTETRLVLAPLTHYHQQKFFAMVVRDLANPDLDSLTPAVLRRWKFQMSARLAPATIRRYMVFLHGALAYGVQCGYLASNPLASLRKPTPAPGRVRFLSQEESARLLVACQRSRNPCLYPLVVLALGTGGRKNELRTLRWAEVDLREGVVRFVRTKGKRPRAVPLVGQAYAVLAQLALRRDPAVPWVFPGRDGRAPRTMEAAWQVARRSAGLADFHFHDLRHTYASYLAMAGASLRDIAELLGHRKLEMVMRYAHLTQTHTRGIVERMWHKFLE